MVVTFHPFLRTLLTPERNKGRIVQYLGPIRFVESFKKCVLPEFSQLDKQDSNLRGLRPGLKRFSEKFLHIVYPDLVGKASQYLQNPNQKERRMAGINLIRQDFPVEIIDNMEHPEPLDGPKTVGHKFHRPSSIPYSGQVIGSLARTKIPLFPFLRRRILSSLQIRNTRFRFQLIHSWRIHLYNTLKPYWQKAIYFTPVMPYIWFRHKLFYRVLMMAETSKLI